MDECAEILYCSDSNSRMAINNAQHMHKLCIAKGLKKVPSTGSCTWTANIGLDGHLEVDASSLYVNLSPAVKNNLKIDMLIGRNHQKPLTDRNDLFSAKKGDVVTLLIKWTNVSGLTPSHYLSLSIVAGHSNSSTDYINFGVLNNTGEIATNGSGNATTQRTTPVAAIVSPIVIGIGIAILLAVVLPVAYRRGWLTCLRIPHDSPSDRMDLNGAAADSSGTPMLNLTQCADV